MKVKREENILEYSSRSVDLDATLNDLAAKDSKEMAKFLVEKTSLPREIRINALRIVLNDYVKIAKELVLSDEFMYRLTWYEKFSEFQLVNFWNILKTKNADRFDEAAEVLRFKKTFYLLLLINADAVGFIDSELEEALELPVDADESFAEFLTEIDDAFYDYEYNFDGLSYEDFKTVLKKSSTVADIRNIAAKYGIQVPKRLKKDEFVALVADGLRRQGKYDETTEAKLKKMSAISLQRFAKVNNIKASTEMKKDDIIDFIMNKIESSPKSVRKPRIQLASLPELEEFAFTKDYLRDVKEVIDEEDFEEEMDAPTYEEPVAEEPVEKPAEEPVIEEEPVKEEAIPEPVVDEIEPDLDELVSKLDEELPVEEPVVEEPVVSEPIVEEPVATPNPQVEKDYSEELNQLENRTESVYSDELLQTIVRLLEERDSKDVVSELLEDNRFNSVIRMYEERIQYLEKTIQDMRTTPVPINITVSYPEAPISRPVETAKCVEEPVVEETETAIIADEQAAETEQAPNVVVTEQVEPVEEEKVCEEEVLEPIVCDSNFDCLPENEKASLAKELMKNADAIIGENEDYVTPRQRRRAKKLAKRQNKLDKARAANDMSVYHRQKRRRFFKVIISIFWIVVLLFVAVVVVGLLLDNGIISGEAATFIDKYLSYVPGFNADGVIRKNAYNWYTQAYNWIQGLIGSIK